MRIVWDPNKSRQNLALHGIALVDAARIFEGPTLERIDDRFDYGEVRIYAIGVVNGVETTVIYTDTPENQRKIISAWKAERHEREAYWKSVRGEDRD